MSNKKCVAIIGQTKVESENFIVDAIEKGELGEFKFIGRNFKNKDLVDSKLIILYDNFKKNEGIEILKKIKYGINNIEVPVIVVLEEKCEELMDRYVELGAYNFITRDYNNMQIKVCIRNAIEFFNTTNKLSEEIGLFDSLLNNIPFMAWLKDVDSNYIKVNNAFMEHSGKTMDDIRGRGDHYVWDGKIGDRCKEFDTLVMNKRKQIMFDEVIEGKKGYKQFNIYKAPVINNNEEVVGTIGVARDITDIKNKDAKVEILLENIPFKAWLKDTDGVYINANSKFVKYIQMSNKDIIGSKDQEIWNSDLLEKIRKEDKEVIEKRKQITFEKNIINQNGNKKIIEIIKSPVFDISNKVIGIVGVTRDITEIRKKQNVIKKYGYTDYLTGLENRRSLYEYMDKKVEKNEYNIALVLIDIDNFKKINDSCGHNFGDKVLVNIANKLRNCTEGAFLARFSGDEFIVIFENILGDEDVLNRVEKLCKFINTYAELDGCKCSISGSMGIGIGTKDDMKLESLLRKADMAMYKAKKQGKRTYAFYEDGMELEMIKCINIEKDLHNAISNNEIEVYYQPLYSKEEKLNGFEALFRWKNEKYKTVPVIDVIEIMEKSNLIKTIGQFIIKEAFLFAKKINEKRKEKLVISVNISPKQIMCDEFIEKFTEIIEDIGVDTKVLAIEITETLFLRNLEENAKKISKIRDLGIKVYLDDFGTGYSSFSYLLNLPITGIKIDRSFIKDMEEREECVKLIKLISDASHSLNLPVVAEGVETRKHVSLLNEIEIDYMQGYLFSKPLPHKEAELLAQES